MYIDAFQSALAKTAMLSLPPHQFKISDKTYIDFESGEKLSLEIKHIISGIPYEELAGQCFTIHNAILEVVSNTLNCHAYFTIGDFSINNKLYYNVNDIKITAYLDKGINIKNNIEMHSWITLPSMEIIDVTLYPTFYKANNIPMDKIGIITGHADKLGAVKYSPFVIGTDYLKRIGAFDRICPGILCPTPT